MRPLGPSGPVEVGPYRVLAELGRGGMGRVLLGSGPDGRLVALKLVHDQFAEDDSFRTRFRREVEASRAVSGAYTAAVVDADPDAPTPWLASVFVPGPSLHEVITAVGALPEDPVLRLAAGLSSALIQIHQAGLVHRDLKPSNVLLTEDGPRVIDFGIVRAVNGDQAGDLTRAGWLVGSPEYMSPEQANGEPVTSASDVFSLGSVVVAACAGTGPFHHAATLQTLNDVVRADPDLSGVPSAIRRIVEPCLAKDPAERPTPAELLRSIGQISPSARPWPPGVHRLIARRHADIARLLDESPEPVDTGTPTVAATRVDTGAADPTREDGGAAPDSTGGPTVARRGRRRGLWLGIAATALVLTGIVTWGVWPELSTALSPQLRQVGAVTASSAAVDAVFSPDGRTLATEHEDNTVQFWDVAGGHQVGQILGPFENLRDMAFSADGTTLTVVRTAGSSSRVQSWDVDSGRQVDQKDLDVSEWALALDALSPDGRTLATEYEGFVKLYEMPGGQLISDLAPRNDDPVLEHERSVLVHGPQGRTLAIIATWSDRAASTDDSKPHEVVTLWDVPGRKQLGDPLTMPPSETVDYAALSPDGRVLVTLGGNGVASSRTLRHWDVASHNQIRQPSTVPEYDEIMFTTDQNMAVTLNDKTLELWNLVGNDQIGPDVDGVRAMTFSQDNRMLATIGDGTVRLWEVPAR
ncbi:WD40 repeat domain-containing serine/threonine protein kinase [Saccharopolyspora indica]|uniref:WD40 repeat domain-containing serine/threonine protein kinase n=1 Tax=Saccharopolyspora indica TaxID=1229659 RepID=UPI0022EA811A|nr:WD40 repeat domain-containing serine/threonine protein kinase [Saccharopolyspora indica]MDA3647995.1 WD40 repeat domain-containing serine/threonine protein kinase [Saccharopolyspora indica]